MPGRPASLATGRQTGGRCDVRPVRRGAASSRIGLPQRCCGQHRADPRMADDQARLPDQAPVELRRRDLDPCVHVAGDGSFRARSGRSPAFPDRGARSSIAAINRSKPSCIPTVTMITTLLRNSAGVSPFGEVFPLGPAFMRKTASKACRTWKAPHQLATLSIHSVRAPMRRPARIAKKARCGAGRKDHLRAKLDHHPQGPPSRTAQKQPACSGCNRAGFRPSPMPCCAADGRLGRGEADIVICQCRGGAASIVPSDRRPMRPPEPGCCLFPMRDHFSDRCPIRCTAPSRDRRL